MLAIIGTLPAAENRRRDVEAEAQDEDQHHAGAQRRHGQRKEDPPEDRALGGAEGCGHLQQPHVDAQHRGIERQDEKGQQHD